MDWLFAIDVGLFRWINQQLVNPVCDYLMPVASGNSYFVPALIAVLILFWVRGGTRGRCLVVMLLLVLLMDSTVVGWLKKLISRPRPFMVLADVRLLVSTSSGYSMPSGHATSWFGAIAVVWILYRQAWIYVLPLACLVSFSRVYNGVHYPSDVLVGAIVGCVVGTVGVFGTNMLWQVVGRRWFPLWWRQLPSIVRGEFRRDALLWRPGGGVGRSPSLVEERQWIHLGYVFLLILFLFRVAYLNSGVIELSKDEAYQWLWSKHLALSYYSKPPLIAWLQFVGTRLFGDTELGVRFFAPFLAFAGGVIILRFIGREVGSRPAFWTLVALSAAPLPVIGTILFTVDAPLVFSWTAAMVYGWRAVQRTGRLRDWIWTGVWIGFGFLSKYAGLLQWIPLVLFILLWVPARVHLRRPGLYVGLLVSLVFTVPVLVWNAQHDWITLTHLENRAGLTQQWRPTLRFFTDFTLSELGLLNPVFACGIIWASVISWKHRKSNPVLFYLFLMGVPLFLGFALYSFRARVYPNWVAPAVVPLFCMLFACGHYRWQASGRLLRKGLIVGLAIGIPLVVILHKSEFVGKVAGRHLPPEADPLRRVRAWRETAAVVADARKKLEAEGKPVFVIGDHYGITSLLTFYTPDAKAALDTKPMIFCRSSPKPSNQFYFWPGYKDLRRGENAIYVAELDPYKLQSGWFWRWIRGKPVLHAQQVPERPVPPKDLVAEFASVEDLGMREIEWRGRGVYRRIWLFACRDLK